MSNHQLTEWVTPLEKIPTRYEHLFGKHWIELEMKRFLGKYPNAYVDTKEEKGRIYIAIFSGEETN